MNPINELSFAVYDLISDAEVGATHDLISVEEGPLAFEAHQPRYDEDEFRRMVERGTQAWAGVADSAAWVEMLRDDGPPWLGVVQSAASKIGDSND